MTVPPAAFNPDPWLAYQTEVNPGGGIQFVSSQVGLSLVGQVLNTLDEQLTAGIGGEQAWPSPGVRVTDDGGRRWRPSLSARGGFWGLDFANTSTGWAVGVTGLYRTVDGGHRWQHVREPAKPLARVAFASAATGVGLTLEGTLVRSTNGGSSWQADRWRGNGEAVCAAGPRTILVADQSGGVWRSSDAGISWRRVAPDLRPVTEYDGWWTDLSCQGTNAVEVAQAFCAAACGGGVIAHVRQTTDAGVSWRELISQDAGSTSAGIERRPARSPNFAILRGVAVDSTTACLIGQPAVSIPISCTSDGGRSYQQATVPHLPFPTSTSTIVIQGVTFAGEEDGWILVDQATAAPRRASTAQSQVWSTHDGGASWTASNTGPKHHL